MTEPVLEVRDLVTRFPTERGKFGADQPLEALHWS